MIIVDYKNTMLYYCIFNNESTMRAARYASHTYQREGSFGKVGPLQALKEARVHAKAKITGPPTTVLSRQ